MLFVQITLACVIFTSKSTSKMIVLSYLIVCAVIIFLINFKKILKFATHVIWTLSLPLSRTDLCPFLYKLFFQSLLSSRKEVAQYCIFMSFRSSGEIRHLFIQHNTTTGRCFFGPEQFDNLHHFVTYMMSQPIVNHETGTCALMSVSYTHLTLPTIYSV